MNVNDSEVVLSVLSQSGFTSAPSVEDADIILLNTCAIRENAESKIWQRLGYDVSSTLLCFQSINQPYRIDQPPACNKSITTSTTTLSQVL